MMPSAQTALAHTALQATQTYFGGSEEEHGAGGALSMLKEQRADLLFLSKYEMARVLSARVQDLQHASAAHFRVAAVPGEPLSDVAERELWAGMLSDYQLVRRCPSGCSQIIFLK